MACKVNILSENLSLLSMASDSAVVCAFEDVSGCSPALVGYAKSFISRPIVSTDGEFEIAQVLLYGATEPLSFAWFSEFKYLNPNIL